MDELIVGINEDEVGNLSIEILDYADNISELFNKIDLCMDRLPNYYKGDACSSILQYYRDLAAYYPIIKNNIVSYSDDLIELVKKVQDGDKEITKLFQEFTDDTKNKNKYIS